MSLMFFDYLEFFSKEHFITWYTIADKINWQAFQLIIEHKFTGANYKFRARFTLWTGALILAIWTLPHSITFLLMSERLIFFQALTKKS